MCCWLSRKRIILTTFSVNQSRFPMTDIHFADKQSPPNLQIYHPEYVYHDFWQSTNYPFSPKTSETPGRGVPRLEEKFGKTVYTTNSQVDGNVSECLEYSKHQVTCFGCNIFHISKETKYLLIKKKVFKTRNVWVLNIYCRVKSLKKVDCLF